MSAKSPSNFDYQIKMRGRFKFIRRKEDETIVEETPWSRNVLCYGLFNALLGGTGWLGLYFNGCVIGTGTATPLESDTALTSYLAATNTSQNVSVVRNSTVSPRFIQQTQTWRFGVGVGTGNIAEAGIIASNSNAAIPNSSSIIGSHGRVVDEFGAPTVITKLADEILDVVWEWTVFVPEDVTGTASFDLDGTLTDIDYTLRACSMNVGNQNSGWYRWGNVVASPGGMIYPAAGVGSQPLSWTTDATDLADYGVAPVQAPAGSNGGVCTGISASAYTPNSKTRDFKILWGLNNGNTVGGIKGFLIGFGLGSFHIRLDTPIVKTAADLFEIDVRVTLSNA